MALPYPYITDNVNNINTGSYLNESEYDMFVNNYTNDFWYGFSEADIIELSIYDLDENLLGWKPINTEKNYKKTTLTYLDDLDRSVTYSYNELITDFTLYKNLKILVNPVEQVSSSFGIIEGSYILTYNFLREMAGDDKNPLVIKDISPSRKEIKLVPASKNNLRYDAFCKKKFQIKDVSPLLLELTRQCPTEQIYNSIKDKYSKEIDFIKQLLFLTTDGAFVSFLNGLYNDTVVYTNPDLIYPLDKVERIQGIRSYFQNYLLSNYEKVSDFIEIENQFNTYVVKRIEKQFNKYGIQKSLDFINSKQFLINFFTTYFYHPITLNNNKTFEEKYYSYLKNALNIGNNKMFIIVDHSFIDERINETDPLTLLIKLKTELSTEVKIQSTGWISNISIAPFIINSIFRSDTKEKTIKISAPDFTLYSENVSLYNTNESYTATDLQNSEQKQFDIDLNKKISELQVDYTDFSNFVIFSSAAQRFSNVKEKIASWYNLSSSLVSLDITSSASISAGTTYPYYALERGSIVGQMDEIINSFDGYESYLFNTGSLEYSTTTGEYIYPDFIEIQEESASLYDRSNRDSLINNTPEHIIVDSNNDEYLKFLNMMGHFFDNIYLYISNLPSEKTIENDPTKTISRKMVDYMLESFGWKSDTFYEDLNESNFYVTNVSESISAEDRVKSIRTRILSTLPQIYKTKGTSDAIKLLLSCYGISSNLLNIREYGNSDYTSQSYVTYTTRERACMFAISRSYAITSSNGTLYKVPATISYTQLFAPKPYIRTVEFKTVIKNPEIYSPIVKYPFFTSKNTYTIKWDENWIVHTYFPSLLPYYTARGYYRITDIPAWEIGFWREYGNMGRIYAELYTPHSASAYLTEKRIVLTSSLFPIFDGEIFNIRLRRNSPSSDFEETAHSQSLPAQYDLTVQRNESGRRIFRSINSSIGYYDDNMGWDGISRLDTWEVTGSYGNTTSGSVIFGTYPYKMVNFALGNIMVWDVPIGEDDFEIHCNDYSSFAYSGSNPETHLITRMDAEEPKNYWSASHNITYDLTGSVIYSYGRSDVYIENKSEYYSTYVDVANSGITPYTGGFQQLYSKPIVPIYIKYTSIGYYPLNPNILYVSNSCCYTSSYIISKYPHEFLVKDIEKTYTTQNYGPNRYKNEKTKPKSFNLDVRVDDKSRSTFDSLNHTQEDSNLLGIYLDPQDAKNRDIIKYLGNKDITSLMANPLDMYSSSYSEVIDLNKTYNSFGNRKVLYNELITLYKIYFNRSIFESIKNIIPARTSARTGIVIEPTILERPKYKYHPIVPELNTGSAAYFDVTASRYYKDPVTKIFKFHDFVGNNSNGKLELLYGEFNVDTTYSMSYFNTSSLPSNPTIYLDISYINDPNFNYPINYFNGYMSDLSDDLQLGNYGSLGGTFGYSEAIGVTNNDNLEKYLHTSGSNKYFLVKKWDKHSIYYKSGSYSKTTNKNSELNTTQSTWLYSLVAMTPSYYNTLFYTSSKNELSRSVSDLSKFEDISAIGGKIYYHHNANTAKGTDNQRINTIRGTINYVPLIPSYVGSPYYNISNDTYFEVFGGYPRNHYTHKRMQYSPQKFSSIDGKARNMTQQIYVSSRQTVSSTIDSDSGLEDSTLPVQSFETSDINLIKSDNVINQ